MSSEIVSLIVLEEGEEAVIQAILGGSNLMGRLASMGLVSGMKIRVVRNIGGPLLVVSNGTRIAIGRGQAQKIAVRRLAAVR
jgi:Fe2+ transport system protein FeoA